jgi:signal transduction histidine kinase
MASLGEMTAGIAHEIQNPLNFVNNFSEVSVELVQELEAALQKGDNEEVKSLLTDLTQNLDKINHHGNRAGAIVRSMLQHSRSTSGGKEPTDINALCDEYLRLAYHGLRAKDKSFNASFETQLDPSVGKLNIIPQEIGRVLLNLINNAFYAVSQRQRALAADENAGTGEKYVPSVRVQTRNLDKQVEIRITDNGTGIPSHLADKVFQPFFTTKPTGEGTGLGLSLSYDIVTNGHQGQLQLESKEQNGTTFIILLPKNT